MMQEAKANLFSVCESNGEMTPCSASVTCIYCYNTKGKCGVKLSGVLAVSVF